MHVDPPTYALGFPAARSDIRQLLTVPLELRRVLFVRALSTFMLTTLSSDVSRVGLEKSITRVDADR